MNPTTKYDGHPAGALATWMSYACLQFVVAVAVAGLAYVSVKGWATDVVKASHRAPHSSLWYQK